MGKLRRERKMRKVYVCVGIMLAVYASDICSQPPYQTGWPQEVARGVDFSSPVLVDVDGDDTLDVVVASNDKLVYMWNQRGELFPNWPRETAVPAGSGETSSPAAGDIDNDGEKEIVYGSYVGERLFAWEIDGTDVAGFPVDLGDEVIRCSATLEDINGDDTLEICIGTGNYQYLFFLFDHRGGELWRRAVAGKAHSTGAVGDLDNDGDIEIIHGTDDATPAGEVYAWHHNGDPVTGWPIIVGHHVDGGPALVDIDGDDSLEVFVGSIDNYLYGWDHRGNDLPGWPRMVGSGSVFDGIVSSPAIGDIDNDTTNGVEVVIGRGIIQSTTGRLLAYHQNGGEVSGFPVTLSGSVTSSPVLADADGDDDLEIFVGCQNGSLYAYHHTGSGVAGFPVFVSPYGVTSSPALADIDLDGDIELAVGGKGSPSGGNDSMYVWDLPGPYNPSKAPWPMFHHDEWHTGLYGKDTGGVGIQEDLNDQLSMTKSQLLQNTPNPFAHSTRIHYRVAGSRLALAGNRQHETGNLQQVSLKIYDLTGRLVRVLVDGPCNHPTIPLYNQVVWDGTDGAGTALPAGVYFCRLEPGNRASTKKMVLMR